jgi:SagB-type dehydrogenase family enzyme
MSRILRASPSAGALYPTEIYVATREVPGLGDGLWSYLVRDHCLIPLWEGDFWQELIQYFFEHEAVRQSRAIILLSGLFSRSEWRYEERAYRRILLDTGHVLGNICLAARRDGFAPYPIGGFLDDATGGLLFLDEKEEVILAAVALPDRDSHRPEAIRHQSALASPPRLADAVPGDTGCMRQLHRAGRLASAADRVERPAASAARSEIGGAGIPFAATPIDLLPPFQEIILKRRSARSFSGAALTKDELAVVLATAFRETLGTSFERRLYFAPELLSTYVVVSAVDGIPPGVYRYLPATQELLEIRRGQFRQQVWHFCLTQELGRDASATVIQTADTDEALAAFGDRAYRYLHLDAGHIGQTMNLAAVALGRGVSGIGGYFDDEINGLLELPFRKIVVYVTTLGVPV